MARFVDLATVAVTPTLPQTGASLSLWPTDLLILGNAKESVQETKRWFGKTTRASLGSPAAGAAVVGLPLRPTDLLIFGAAKGGTPLMQAAQTIGIDLPLKALVWQDVRFVGC
jgi:hypothetical protein